MLSKLLTERVQTCFHLLDVSPHHASLYLALLEEGKASVAVLAQKITIPRSTAYLFLTDLQRLGLLSEVRGESKKIFTPAQPDRLLFLVRQKMNQLSLSSIRLEESLPDLLSLYTAQEPKFPRVRFYEGEEGLRTVLYDCLSSDEIWTICQGTDEGQLSLEKDPLYLKDFIAETMFRHIHTRELLQDCLAVREYQKKYASDEHEIIITPPNQKLSIGHVDKHIYGDKVAYISHDNKIGIILEDQTLTAHEREQFNALWLHYRKS